MPRTPRIVHPGAWYHITARGIERRPIFKDRRDRVHFLELLAELTDRFAVRLHAYVLMENHYHLMLELLRPNLSRAIQWLNVSYSVWFNRRHQRAGYLFQGRFKSIVVDPLGWGLSLSAYVHLNPVRTSRLGLSKKERERSHAGVGNAPSPELVQKRIGILRDFPWSSYRAYVGLTPTPAWLQTATVLENAGGPKKDRPGQYRCYVENQIRQGLPLQPWEELRDQILLGSARFIVGVKKSALEKAGPKSRRMRWRETPTTLAEVIRAVEESRGLLLADFQDKHGDSGRDMILYLARKTTGLTAAALAKEFGLKQHANVSMAVKRFAKRIEHHSEERKIIARAARLLNITL